MIADLLPVDGFDTDPEEVRSRIAEARRRGEPAWLWPEVSPSDWRRALKAIEGVVSALLREENHAVLPEIPNRVLSLAGYTSGTGPLLGHWVAHGLLEASPENAAVLEVHRSHNARRMSALTATLEGLLAGMTAAGLRPVVLKGMHASTVYFPDPAARPVTDIDIFVARREFDAASRVLRAAGFRERARQGRPLRSDWVPPNDPGVPRSLWLSHADDPYSVDLHASLDREFFGVRRIRFDEVLATIEEHLGTGAPPASPRRVLSQPLLTLLLATHASEGLHSLSLIRLVELCLVIGKDTERGRLDWDDFLSLTEATDAARFAFPALSLSERLLPGTVPSPVLSRLREAATPAMRRVIDSVSPGTAQRIDRPLSLAERLMWAGSSTEFVLRVAHGLWPAPAGRSLRRLAGIYRDRAWRVIRGAVER